ncbi:(deoxy)nucleoside triphosphate pyrophosphohydrolase [Archangium primigenium]|uniref:(deoxy)nucleoside triphosphate pyrophosphohydrolase n=1 Tax=[Archangium] primigenium TaxID=2792470 RepID=UPI00195D9885|nr:(deoxy)nucleoside triphosphate pyrophosphohydrolase [Archangium primigenium]MBM7117435.1 (deoxy)nucleoside triphosphate pyrophosphohydrolase [Archangium primigenium]
MARRQIRVVGAMLQNAEGRYLITQRPPKATLPLLWEFPGGRVEEGEGDEQALAREIREEMGVEVEVLEQALHTHHEYPAYDIDFRVYRCRLAHPDAAIQHVRVHDHRWVLLEEMQQYRFPDADSKTLARLLDLEG